MNILIPMAGNGLRTHDYSSLPKPLAEINGKPMIEWVLKTLNIEGNYTFITRKYAYDPWNKLLNIILKDLVKNPTIIEIDYLTEGPAASALLGKDIINDDDELVIVNCDQIMDWKSEEFLKECRKENLDGLVVTQKQSNPKNSYIQLNEKGYGIKLAEKELISDHALTGLHYWKKGEYFIQSAEQMIKENIRYNNEFYISLSYNQLINQGLNIGIYEIGLEQNWASGSTEDIYKFINNGNIKI